MELEELWSAFTLSPVTVRVILLVLLLIFASPAAGQPQVIGSAKPIRAFPGNDVVLPCHVEPPSDVARLTVEWSKPDLKPDPLDRLGRVEYVHLYRDGKELLDMKISSYMRRTTLFSDGLHQGNISLKISNVTAEDEGRYKCFLPKLKGRVQYSIVRLVVDPYISTTETPLQLTTVQNISPRKGSTDVKGVSRRSRIITVVVVCLLLLLVFVGVGVQYFLRAKQELIRIPTVEVHC